MSSRRPPRGPGGFGQSVSGGEDSPAQTNLGLLLKRALEQASQQSAAPADEAQAEEAEEIELARDTKLCADCWNAIVFKDESGKQMARCAKDLWVRPVFTYEELNSNKIRRWYGDCPEYDDSE